MDNRPIGVFDTGLGGLTSVKEIMKALPNEDVVYFGDTGRVPYGTRSREAIIKYAKQDMRFLMEHNIKAIVIACGTVSSVAIKEAASASNVPVLGVVESAVNEAVNATKNNIIGVLGTAATISSNSYDNALNKINSYKIIDVPCPLFVPLVENGYFKSDNEVARLVAQEYLKPVKEAKADTVILGCTHYPLLSDIIQSILGEDVILIDSGKAVVNALAKMLAKNNLLTDKKGGNYSFYVSDSAESFSSLAEIFLEKNINGTVEKIEIEMY